MAAVGRGRGRGQGRGPLHVPWSTTNSAEKEQHSIEKASPNEHELMREKMVQMAAKYSMDSDESSEDEIYDDEIVIKTIQEYKEVLQGNNKF